MAVSRQKKEEVLAKLTEAMKEAKSAAFTQYSGTDVTQMGKLRKRAREANVSITIAKKTLIQKAAQETGYPEIPDEILDGAIAVALGPDEVSAAKVIKDAAKEIETLKLVGGLMDGKVLDRKQVQAFADLPTKDELLAKFMGMIQSPLRNFAYAISSPLSSFARAAKAYAEQKGE